MGLVKNARNESNATFLSVRISTDAKGKQHAVFAKRCEADDPDAVQVFKANKEPATTKDGAYVYRQEFDALNGQIVFMERDDVEFADGKRASYLKVYIKDGDDLFILSLDRGDQYWSDFLLRLPLYDPTVPAYFQPYLIEKDGEKGFSRGISMKQGGKKIERRWSSTAGWDGGPPQATYDQDEKEWDYKPRTKWLEQNVMRPIAEEIAALGLFKKGEAPAQPPASPSHAAGQLQATKGYGEIPPIGSPEDDDLPF